VLTQHQECERFEQIIIAHHDPAFTKRTSRCFGTLGWQVFTAGTACEARRLARVLSPSAMILDTELPDESGWLMCDKLSLEHPEIKIFLVSPRRSPHQVRFAEFVGAAGLLWRYGGLKALADEVDGDLVAAAV
jgi:DNA-binding response OmpR family regulator